MYSVFLAATVLGLRRSTPYEHVYSICVCPLKRSINRFSGAQYYTVLFHCDVITTARLPDGQTPVFYTTHWSIWGFFTSPLIRGDTNKGKIWCSRLLHAKFHPHRCNAGMGYIWDPRTINFTKFGDINAMYRGLKGVFLAQFVRHYQNLWAWNFVLVTDLFCHSLWRWRYVVGLSLLAPPGENVRFFCYFCLSFTL